MDTSYLSEVPYSQATQVAAATTATAQYLIRVAKEEEYIAVVLEPGVVADVDLASIIYSIPEAGEIETPTIEQDENLKEDTGSDVSIEPYMAEWKDYEVTDTSIPDLILMRWASP